MTARLGPGGCAGGRHVDCPAGPRLLAYHDRENTDRRRAAIAADTHRADSPAAGAETARPT